MGIQSIHRAAVIANVVLAAVVFPVVASAQAFVRGTLYDDSTGTPVRGTVMLVDPATNGPVVHTVSDALGSFELKTSNGVYQIAAVRSGYTSVLSAPVQLRSGESITIRVPISQTGDPAHKIAVLSHIRPQTTRDPNAEQETGLEERRVLGAGLQYDRAALARSNVQTLGEFLQDVPGLDVGDPSSTSTMQMTRTANTLQSFSATGEAEPCQIGWFIDGYLMNRNNLDPITDGLGSMQLSTIDAIEVFRGTSEVPPQFAEPGVRCGAVAIWLRKN